MGTVSDEVSSARFGLKHLSPAPRWCFCWLRVHFSGTGSTLADLTLNIDSHRETPYDSALWVEKSVGLTVDVSLRTPEDELFHWLFESGDELVLTWTNPHVGTLFWGATVGLWPLA